MTDLSLVRAAITPDEPPTTGEWLEQSGAPQAPLGGLRIEATPTGAAVTGVGESTLAAPQAPGAEGDPSTP